MLRIRSKQFHKFKPLRDFLMVVTLITASMSITTACGIDKSADQSFVTGKPCVAPCWYGLNPGKSTLEEVNATLKQLPFVNPLTIREKTAYWLDDKDAKDITYDCTYPASTSAGCGGLIIYKGKATAIWMYIAYPLTFGDAAKQLGEPDYVSYSPTGPEDLTCIITLYWTKKSISATTYNGGRQCPAEGDLQSGVKIKSDLQITTLDYSEPNETPMITKPCNTCIQWPGFDEK